MIVNELIGRVFSFEKTTFPASSELFHKLVGPGVGLVDRLRDKLTGRATK